MDRKTQQPLLARVFVSLNSMPAFLELFAMGLEFFIFSIFISSRYITEVELNTPQLKLKTILVLIFLLLFRAITRAATLVRIVYLPVIAWLSISEMNYQSYIITALLSLNIMIDVLSKVQYSFYTSNIQSESLNLTKIFHYLVLSTCTFLQLSPEPLKTINQPIIHGICAGLVVLLFLMKTGSVMKNPYLKEFYQRFYFLSVFYFCTQILDHFVEIDSIFLHLIAILGSQIIMTILCFKSKEIATQQYLSKDAGAEITFLIMSYIFSKTYNESNEASIDKLLERNINPNNQQNPTHLHRRNIAQDTFLAGKKLLSLLEERNHIELILKAQLFLFVFGRVLQAKICIQRAKQSASTCFDKLIVYRMEMRVRNKVSEQYYMYRQDYFDDFIANEYFRTQLVRGAMNYVCVWEYLESSQLIYEKLNTILQKLTSQRQKIQQQYDKLKVKCLQITQLYIDFLFTIVRDVKQARLLHQRLIFNEQFELDLKCQDKIYIKFKLQGSDQTEPLTIGSAGSNICTKLGYSKKQIQGARHTIFLPEFYHQEHKFLANQAMRSKNIYHYTKKTVIKHQQNFYLPCQMNLKLQLLPDHQLELVGYISIIDRNDANFMNYLFVRQSNGDIIQCSSQTLDIQGKSKKKNIRAFFDNHNHKSLVQPRQEEDQQEQITKTVKKSLNQKQTHTYNDIIYEYVPLALFPFKSINSQQGVKPIFGSKTRQSYQVQMKAQNDIDNVILFVCMDPFRDRLEQEQQQNNDQLNKDRIQRKSFPLYKFTELGEVGGTLTAKQGSHFNLSIIEYLRVKQTLMQRIKSPGQFLLLFLAIFMMIGALTVQIFSHTNISATAQYQSGIMQNTHELILHQMALTKLAVSSNLQYIQDNYSYKQNQYTLDFVAPSLEIQRTNNKFKRFSISKFPVVNQDGSVSNISTYQLIVNVYSQLISLVYLDVNAIRQSSLKYTTLDNLRVVLIDTFDEYSQEFSRYVSNENQYRFVIKVILLSVIALCCFLTLIMVLKIQKSSRQQQHETLKAIAGLGKQTRWCQIAKVFIKKVTFDQEYYRYSKDFVVSENGGMSVKQIKDMKTQSKLQKNIEDNQYVADSMGRGNGEISSRDNTYRDLMNDTERDQVKDTSNYDISPFASAREGNRQGHSTDNFKMSLAGFKSMKSNTQQIKQSENGSQVKLKPANKILVIGSLVIVLLIISTHATNWVLDTFVSPFDQYRATQNLINLANQNIMFSTVVASFFSILGHNKKATDYAKIYNDTLNRYYNYQKTLIEFKQNSLPDFSGFGQKFNNYKYSHLCDYQQCKLQYQAEIHIVYSTVIQKMVNYMDSVLKDTSTNSSTFFMQQSSSAAKQLAILIYAEKLLKQIMNNTITTYMDNFSVHNQKSVQTSFILTSITTGIICLLVIGLFIGCTQVSKLQKKFVNMSQIVKNESYDMKQIQVMNSQNASNL